MGLPSASHVAWVLVVRPPLLRPIASFDSLFYPASPEVVQAIVDQYATDEPDILRRDFYNSLLAAFTEDEIGSQLARMNLTRLLIDIPDDRHWVVGGIIY